jgi:hypothetical protein
VRFDWNAMKVIVDYLLIRPLGALINGFIIGMYLPLTTATLLAKKAGRVWAMLLTPIWLALMLLTIPLSIVYCFVMVMVKGPFWQYPPDQRGQPNDWITQEGGSNHGGK